MRTLETNQPLSDSQLWRIVANYYMDKGPNAWIDEETPNFVTSSCYIAEYYARVILNAMLDWHRNADAATTPSSNIISAPAPFYIIELSAGLGEFAFHCLRQLRFLLQLYELTELKFCYVLTDIVTENITSWQQSHAFADYIVRGEVDFAYYDLTQPQILELTNSKIRLDRQQLTQPVIVIANYVFDSVPCDVFQVDSKQLWQGLMTLEAPIDFNPGKPKDLGELKTNIQYQPVVDPNIYREPLFNNILHEYRQTLRSGVINLQVSAMRYLQFLLDLSQGRMLLLIADKGYSTKELMQQVEHLYIDYHVSISVMVNFHALELFFQHYQGDCAYQDRFTQLTTAVYTAGITLANMPNTNRYLQLFRQEMSPQEYCRLLQQMSVFSELDALCMLAIFRLSKNDPIILRIFNRHIMKLTNPYKINFNQVLREIVNKMRDNTYPLRKTPLQNYYLGCAYLVMGDYELALEHIKPFVPTPALEYDYWQYLYDCYLHLGEEEEVAKIKSKLRWLKVKAKLHGLCRKLQPRHWARRNLRLLILSVAVLVLIYLIIEYL